MTPALKLQKMRVIRRFQKHLALCSCFSWPVILVYWWKMILRHSTHTLTLVTPGCASHWGRAPLPLAQPRPSYPGEMGSVIWVATWCRGRTLASDRPGSASQPTNHHPEALGTLPHPLHLTSQAAWFERQSHILN
jgi:hypothetical protein